MYRQKRVFLLYIRKGQTATETALFISISFLIFFKFLPITFSATSKLSYIRNLCTDIFQTTGADSITRVQFFHAHNIEYENHQSQKTKTSVRDKMPGTPLFICSSTEAHHKFCAIINITYKLTPDPMHNIHYYRCSLNRTPYNPRNILQNIFGYYTWLAYLTSTMNIQMKSNHSKRKFQWKFLVQQRATPSQS